MSAESATQKNNRRRFVLDRPFQLSIAFTAVALLNVVALSFLSVIYVIPDETFLTRFSAPELRNFIVRMNAIYYLVSTAAVAVLAIIITHRIAGPAMVLKRAVESLARGRHSPRLKLRKRDYLQDLAAALGKLSNELEDRQQRQNTLLSEIHGCLKNNNVEAARDLVSQELQREPAPMSALEHAEEAPAEGNSAKETTPA